VRIFHERERIAQTHTTALLNTVERQKGELLARDTQVQGIKAQNDEMELKMQDLLDETAQVARVCVAVRCGVVQWGAVGCSVVQCGAGYTQGIHGETTQVARVCGAVWCSVVQGSAGWCSVLLRFAVCCSVVQCGAVWCRVVQCARVC